MQFCCFDFGREHMEEDLEANSIDLEDSKLQWDTIQMCKKRREEFIIKIYPYKEDMQTNINNV